MPLPSRLPVAATSQRVRGLGAGSAAAILPVLLATASLAAEFGSLEGLSVEAAIAKLETSGLRVFYSSDLVKPAMRVVAEPSGRDPRVLLAAIVAPYGLTIEDGPARSVLVVRRPPPASPPPVAEPTNEKRPGSDEPPRIDELIVAASRYELARSDVAPPLSLSGSDIERLPDIGDDALRAVQRLPGTTLNGVSARTNVRGGEVGETLVRFDELRLYDPFHLENFQGVFSTVDPRIVSSMDVYTGGFPAIYGDRMSSVIDVASLRAPAKRYQEIGFSFFNASFLSAGTFAEEDGEWLVSVRRSNLDLLYGAFSDQPERPRYFDGYARVGYRLPGGTRVSVNALRFRDDIELRDDLDAEETATSKDEDHYFWLRFDHDRPARRLHGTTLVARTELGTQRSGVSEKEGIDEGFLLDRRSFAIDSVQTDWSWVGSGALRAQFGATAARSHGTYDYTDEVELALLVDTPGAATAPTRTRDVHLSPSGSQLSAFGTLRYSPTERLAADMGVRWDRSTLSGTNDDSLGPRLGLRYRLAERTFLRASWGRFYQSQSINELQVSDGVERYFAPQRADHFVVGLEHEFPAGLELRVEAYDKRLRDLRPRFENLLHELTLLPELKPDRIEVNPESGRARGIEVSVGRNVAPDLQWWVAYGYASVTDRLAGIDRPRNWDQRHALSSGFTKQAGLWNVSLALSYRSGWPTTPVIGLDTSVAVPILEVGDRNSERGELFRSLDVRAERDVLVRRGHMQVFVEVSNVLNRSNRCCTEFQIEQDELGQPFLELTPVNYLPLVPSLGFVWSF